MFLALVVPAGGLPASPAGPSFAVPAGSRIDVPVDTQGASERAPQRRGEVARAIDGTLLSTVSGEARSLALTTGPLTDDEGAVLRALVRGGRFVEVGGTLLEARLGLAAGGTAWAVVEVGETTFQPDDTVAGPVPRYAVALTLLFA